MTVKRAQQLLARGFNSCCQGVNSCCQEGSAIAVKRAQELSRWINSCCQENSTVAFNKIQKLLSRWSIIAVKSVQQLLSRGLTNCYQEGSTVEVKRAQQLMSEEESSVQMKFVLCGDTATLVWSQTNPEQLTVAQLQELMRERYGSAKKDEKFQAELLARRRKAHEDLPTLRAYITAHVFAVSW